MATVSDFSNSPDDSRGLLPAKLEKIQVLLPVFVLCGLGFFYSFVFQRDSVWTNHEVFDLFIASILLNTVHVGFTVAGQWSLPTYRSWRNYLIGDVHSLRFWSTVGIFLFTWLMLFMIFNRNIEASFLEISLRRWVIFIYSLLLQWHSLHQARGISLMYNNLSPLRDHPNRNGLGKRERLGVAIILGAVIAFESLRFFLNEKASTWVVYFTSIGLIGAYIAIKASHDTDPHWRTNKFFFSLRYLLWPVTGFNIIALIALRILHGFEYTLLNWTMLSRARKQMDEKNSKRALKITFSILILFFIFAWLRSPVVGQIASSFGFTWRPVASFVAGFVISCTLAHMLWDRSYFSMEKTELRADKAALLGFANTRV